MQIRETKMDLMNREGRREEQKPGALLSYTANKSVFANPGAGSTSATHAQTHWGGQGQL